MLSDVGAHLLLFHVRPNLDGLGGKSAIFTDYRSQDGAPADVGTR